MKIIDAHWELRNLGVSTKEIEVEESDSIDELRDTVYNIDSEYTVVKISTARVDCYRILSECGFYFVESLIKVSHGLKDLSCSGLIMRMSDQLEFCEMCEDEILLMGDQIRGGMFQTDRVSLDPFFNSIQAANRYVMWMSDERERGSRLYNYKYKGQPIGFSCFKESKPMVFYPVLGGVYNYGKSLPFGTAIIYKQLEIAKELGGKELYTFISSNNQAVVRTYSQLGYSFDEMRYVFVKHV